jgi:hypothetical protein
MERLDPRLLPPQVRDLIRILGTEDALRILRQWGGQRRWVPEHPALASAQLRGILSPEGLAALCSSRFAGQSTDWPKADKALGQAIHAAMRADRAAGATANELASRYGYTTRRVRTIAPKSPASDTDSVPLQPDFWR